MKTKILFFIFLSGIIHLNLFAQYNSTYKRMYQDADDYVYAKNYVEALPLFKQLDSLAPENANIQFYLGICYLHSYEDKSLAIPYLENAIKDVSVDYYGSYKEKSAPVHSFLYLGKAYHYNYEFDKAIDNLNKFIYYLTKEDKDLKEEAERYIQMSYTGKQLIAKPISVKTTNIGDKINTKYAEYSPVLTPDGKNLYFTSRRGTENDAKDYFGLYYENIYHAEYNEKTNTWSEAKALEEINSSFHEATINISYDGQTLYLYKDIDGTGNIYYSEKKGKTWSTPQKMDSPINTKHYENHACVCANGKFLYFVSNRPGGFGGKDIWVAEKDKDGNWANVQNLGPKINTAYDEDAPFLLSDSKTLFFSSQGHETMGGYDIFISERNNEGEWSTPQNIGSPLNTPNDDIFFFPMLDGKKAYYASDQLGGYGEKDIYSVSITSSMEQLAVISGFVIDTTTNAPLEALIRVKDKDNKIIATTRPDKKTGEYSLSLNPGYDYVLEIESVDGEIIRDMLSIPKSSQNELSFNKPFHFFETDISPLIDTISKEIVFGERIGDRYVLENIYFDFNKSNLRDGAKEELNKVVDIMNKYPMITLEFSGHTDSIGSDSYNQKLSEQRVKAVVEYLISQDVDKERLSYVGYGETRPIATNSTDEGRQKNRRIEFRISSVIKSAVAINNYTVETKRKPLYYVIAGSFEMYKNADRYRIELLAQGHENAQIIGQSSVGTFRVAYDVFEDKDTALSKRLEIMEKTEREGLWILTK